MLHPMHSVTPLFSFEVNNTQTIGGLFSTISGKTISVDWGDGSARSSYSGTDQAYSKDYGSAGNRTVRIFGSVALTKFTSSVYGADISFDIANLPASLLDFAIGDGVNTITGDIANLPASLESFECQGYSTVSGDIANLPASLTHFHVTGQNIVSGDLANLPASLAHFSIQGEHCEISGDVVNLPASLTYFCLIGSSNTVTGDVANLPPLLAYFYVEHYNTISSYSGKTWTTTPRTFYLSLGGLSWQEMDQLLIDFDDDLTWSSGDVIWLRGSNGCRSHASDGAVSHMEYEGAYISVNCVLS